MYSEMSPPTFLGGGVDSTILAGRKSNGGMHDDKEQIDVGDVATPLIAPSRIPSHDVGPRTDCIE